MADPSRSAIHLTMRRGEHVLSTGSGVLYARGGRHFVATAWHNFSGRNSDTFAPLSKQCAVPDNVVVSVSLIIKEAGSYTSHISVALPLQDDNEATYLIHPRPWPRTDVAVLPIDPDAVYPLVGTLGDGRKLSMPTALRQTAIKGGVSTDIQPIQACLGTYGKLPTSPMAQLRAGDDLFVLGYPRGISDRHGAPIWKRASVASDPQSGGDRHPNFLIDCASRSGMSGAPVVIYSRSGNVRRGGTVHMGSEPSTALCGIYVGRLRDPGPVAGQDEDGAPDLSDDANDELFQAQLGRVWKVDVIDQIIDAGVRAPHPDFLVVSPKAIDQALTNAWPRERFDQVSHLHLPMVRYNVVTEAIEALKGNVETTQVYRAYDAKVAELEKGQSSESSAGKDR